MRKLYKGITKRIVAVGLALVMSVSLVGPLQQPKMIAKAETSEELPTVGARSESNSYGDVFLGGNYIEVGISKHGSFGTAARPTGTSWHPHRSANGLGLTSDGDGWDVGEAPQTGDFFLPGTPEECWGFGYKYNGTTYNFFVRDRNYGSLSNWKTEPTVKDESNVEKGELKAVVTGETIHGVEIKITYSFGVDDKFYNTTVEVNNKSGKEISDVRFIRSFDPDQDQQVYGDYSTYNKVICNPVSTMEAGGENFAMVVARGYKSLAGFFFLAFDNRARVSRGVSFSPYDAYEEGFWDYAPVTTYTYAVDSELELTKEMVNSYETNGYYYEDSAIAITFDFGALRNGDGDVCTFASSLDPDVEASLEAVKKAAGISVDPEYGRLEGFVAGNDYEIVTYDPADTEKENPIKKWKVTVEEDGSYIVEDASGNIVDEGTDAVNTGVYFLDEWYGYNLLVIKKGVDGEEDAESEIEAVNPGETVVPDAPSEENKKPVVTGKVSALEITNLKADQQYRIYDYNNKLIKDWFMPSEDEAANGYVMEPIACGCANTAEHTHPYYVVTRYAGDENGLPSNASDKIATSPNVTIPKVDSEVDLAEGNVEIIADGIYQQYLEDGTVVRYRYANALKVVQSDAATTATTNTIKSLTDNANIILSGVNINITDGVTTPVEASGAIKITMDGSNRIGTSSNNAIVAGAIEFAYAGSVEDGLSIDAKVQSIVAEKTMPSTVAGFDGKTSAEFENTDADTVVDDNESVAINRPQLVYVGGKMIVQNGLIIESALEEFADTVTYDSKTATLVLDGAELTGMYSGYAVYADGDLRIDVKNESTIALSGSGYTYGLYVEGEATIIGDTLNINKTDSMGVTYECYGVYAKENVNIKNDTKMEFMSNYAFGVNTVNGDVNVTGGTLSVVAPNSIRYAVRSQNGNVNITDSELNVTMPKGYGVYAYNTGMAINFTGSTANIEATYGLYNYNGNVELEESDVTIQSTSYGVYTRNGAISVTDTNLDITARTSETSTSGNGMYATKVDIDGGDIDIKAGNYGIQVTSGLNIADGTIDISSNYAAVYSSGKIDVSGGDIKAEGNTYGIYISSSSSSLFVVSDGNILAKGNTAAINYYSAIDLSKCENVIALTGDTEDGLTEISTSNSSWHRYKKVVNIVNGFKSMTGINAPSITKKYDGVGVGIAVTGAPEGSVIRFRDDEGNYTLTESPKYMNASETPYTVHFEVTCEEYSPYRGSATIKIDPVEVEINANALNATVSENPHKGYVAGSVTATYTMGGVAHTMNANDLVYKYYANSGSTSLTGAPIAVGTYTLVISTADSNYVGSKTLSFEIKEKVSISGTVQWNYAYSYSDDYGNVQSGVVDDIDTQRSKKAAIKLYNNGVLVEGFEYIVEAVAGTGNTASGSYSISGLPSVIDGVDANYTIVIIPLVNVTVDGDDVKEAESYYVTTSGNNGYINYIPECFDATWTVKIEDIETIDGMVPTEIFVKVLYATKINGTYQKITQMADSSAVCILVPNEDGGYTATGSYPVWKTQTDGTTYYHRVQIVGYKVNGTYVDTTGLGLISNDENIMYYDLEQHVASRDIELALPAVQVPVVKINANGGNSEESYILMNAVGGKLNVDEIIAERPYYELVGWTLNGEVVSGEITVNGKMELKAIWKDVTAPNGSVSVEGERWSDFSNDITFDNYFKQDVLVQIGAEDLGEGLEEVLYFISDAEMSESEVDALADDKWTSGSNFALTEDGEYVVYVKLVDKEGNVTYISSQGMTVDKSAPVINGIVDDKVYCQEQTFSVSDDNLDQIMINGAVVDIQEFYELVAGDGQAGNTYEITALDKAGNKTVVNVTINNGHEWHMPVFIWSEDFSEVTANFVCKTDETHIEVVEGTVAAETTDASCEVAGKIVYTATVVFEGTTYFYEKEVEIPATGHDWHAPVFIWSEDFSGVTVSFVCKTDETHIEELEGTVTAEKTDASCAEAGKIVYTATVEFEDETYVDTKEVTIPATGHDWSGDWTVIKDATATEEGKKSTLCENGCGQKKVVTIPAIGQPEDEGNFEKDVEVSVGAPIDEVTINNTKEELLATDKIFTEEEKEKIKDGDDARVWLEITKTDEESMKPEVTSKFEEVAVGIMGADLNITFFEVDLFKQIGVEQKVEITEPGVGIKITIAIPTELLNEDESVERKYMILRMHDGEVEVINGEFNAETGEFTFETDKFSTYAIVYEDVPVVENGPTVPETGDNSDSLYTYMFTLLIGLALICSLMRRKNVLNM